MSHLRNTSYSHETENCPQVACYTSSPQNNITTSKQLVLSNFKAEDKTSSEVNIIP